MDVRFRIAADNVWSTRDSSSNIADFTPAVEAALQLRDKNPGSEAVAISGSGRLPGDDPQNASMGVDRGIHLKAA
jgi:electron transfer flavoprotein alpha/beta subunit